MLPVKWAARPKTVRAASVAPTPSKLQPTSWVTPLHYRNGDSPTSTDKEAIPVLSLQRQDEASRANMITEQRKSLLMYWATSILKMVCQHCPKIRLEFREKLQVTDRDFPELQTPED